MREPDAMDLERIGRALAAEFTEEVGPEVECFECGYGSERGHAFLCLWTYHHPQPGREDAERLVAILDRLGFRVVTAPRPEEEPDG